MILPTILFWMMISTTSGQECSLSTLKLYCPDHMNGNATWNNPNNCIYKCEATWSCTNGESFFDEHRSCSYTWENLAVQWKSYMCSLTVTYKYDGGDGKAIRNCSAYAIDIQPVDMMLVSDPLEIHCLVYTANISNSDDVTISWTGPNGTITNDNRLTITPTVSNGTNHISTLQFSYLSEYDEGLYECSTTVLSYGENKSTSVELTNFTIPTPNVIVTALNNQQVGDPLLLECNVTTVRGITSSVDIVWVTNDEVVRRVNDISGETVDNSVVYSDTYDHEELLLSEQDDGIMYHCYVEIKAPTVVSANDTVVLNVVAVTPSVSAPEFSDGTSYNTDVVTVTPSVSVPKFSDKTSYNTVIIISSVAAMVTLTFVVIILGYFVYKRRSKIIGKWNSPKTEYMTPAIDDDMDYSIIGREAPSTCEHLDNEKGAHWIDDIQMPTIDEDCASIHSGGRTNDDILKLVYGKIGHNNDEMINGKYPYLSESVVFHSSHQSMSTNNSTINDNFQATLGDQDNTLITKKKHNVEHEDMSYKQTTSGSDKGYYVDYNTARTASLSYQDHQNQTMTVLPDSTDGLLFEVAKQSEDNDHIPYVVASEDIIIYSTSCFSDNATSPDGDHTTCSIAIHPIDKTATNVPKVTPISHHSD